MKIELDGLQGRVKNVGALRRFRGKVSGTLAVALALAGVYLVYSGFDIAFKLDRPWRVLSFAVGAVCVGWAGWRLLVRPLLGRARPTEVAMNIEKAYPDIEEALSTSIEYGADPEKAKRLSSPALVEALVEDTHLRTRNVDFERTVDWRFPRRLATSVLIVLAVLAVAAASYPHLFGKTFLRLLNPLGATPPPTFTVIDNVEPGDVEIARGDPVEIEIDLAGSVPEDARVMLSIPSEIGGADDPGEARVEEMARGDEPGKFHFRMAKVAEDMTYRIAAGDAESRPYEVIVYEEPRVLDVSLLLEYPEYTGLEPKEISDGLGEISALRGTRVTVRARLNKPVVSGRLRKGSGDVEGEIFTGDEDPDADPSEKGPRLEAAFTVTEDDWYSVRLVDERGRGNDSASKYTITAQPDRAPRVRIVTPGKEVMAFRNQPVEITIEADDDYGVKEIGIYHTLGGDEGKLVFKKFGGPGVRDADEKHSLQLGFKAFKGGEIIQYYAYAKDSDTVDGPKEAIGELHFIRTYDEEAYAPGPQQKRKKMPPAAKKVEGLIKRQMEVLKKSFELARDETRKKADPDATVDLAELARKAKAFSGEQTGIKKDLDELLAEIEEELPDQRRAGGGGETPIEMEELRSASKKMGVAAEDLEKPEARQAASREAEALRHLSEAQRLILSEFADPSMQQAMQNSARKQKQRKRRKQQQQAEQMEQEMAKLPPMLEREDKIERELEKLDDEEQMGPGTPEEQDKRRKLKRKLAEEQKKMATQAQQSAQKMQQMAKQQSSKSAQQAAEAMQQASSAMKQSAQSAEQNRSKQAAKEAAQAKEELERAAREMQRSLEKSVEERIAAAKADAESMAQREQDVAQEARQAEGQQQKAEAEAKQAKSSGDAKGQAQAQAKADAAKKEAGQTAKGLSSRQESLKKEAQSLADELSKLAGSAKSKPADVTWPLESAKARAASGEAKDRMEAAKKAFEAGKLEQAAKQAEAAAREMAAVAEDLKRSLEALNMNDAEKLAAAVEKAEEILRKETEIAAKAGRGEIDPKMAAEQEALKKSARELAEAAPGLKAVREAGKSEDVRRSFSRAAERMRQAADGLNAKDPKAAEQRAVQAVQEAAKGLEALQQSSKKDLETALSKLLKTAREAEKQQEKVDRALTPAPKRAEEGRPLTDEEAKRAAADEAAAAERTEELAEQLSSAEERLRRSRPGDRLPKELGDLADRLERAQVADRMDKLAENLRDPGKGLKDAGEARKLSEEEKALLREIAAASRRLESLSADAADDELKRLRAAESQTREVAKAMDELGKEIAQASKEGKPSSSEKPGEEPGSKPTAKGMRDRAEGLADDLTFLQRRLEEMKLAEEDMKKVKRTRDLLKEVTRSLSRNQMPRPTNQLAQASGDFQAIGDEIMRRIEQVLKKRKITEPADETAPEEYRRLVEKYYRALSEDK